MAYKYTHFISQNIAPSGTRQLVLYNNTDDKVCTIPLGRLEPITKDKQYSFGLVSDIHLYPVAAVEWTPETKFRNALSYFQNNDCMMCIHCGDITQTGFYRSSDGTIANSYYDDTQMQEYKTIRNEYTMPAYGICGNHENYYSNVTNNLDEIEDVIGIRALSYSISSLEATDTNIQLSEIGNDVFILLGQPSGSAVMSDEDLQWFYEVLEENRNKRCFVFVHAYIEEDSGDPMDVRENSIFDHWGTIKTTLFKNLLKHYKNTILFHGHSHMKFENQKLDKNANLTERNGFKSVHIPSLGVPRDIDTVNNVSVDDRKASEGYIVDVYDDCIVLNGMDFINNEHIPLGVYKIDTTLQTIEEGTFTDSTGTITI